MFDTGCCAELTEIMNSRKPLAFSTLPPVIGIVDQPKLVAGLLHDIKALTAAKSEYTYESENCWLTTVSFKKQPIALFIEPDRCLSYIAYKGRRIASVHTIVYLCYTIALAPNKAFDAMRAELVAIGSRLSHLQMHSLTSRRKLLQQVGVECIGRMEGLITMFRKRQSRMSKRAAKAAKAAKT